VVTDPARGIELGIGALVVGTVAWTGLVGDGRLVTDLALLGGLSEAVVQHVQVVFIICRRPS
jgi:nucleotide-binding universal stress UspA family protein